MNTTTTPPQETTHTVPEVGRYYMKGEGTCVRITEARETEPRGTVFGVEYVQTPTGPAIQGGGSSFWWDAPCFTPITDPFWLAAAKGHDAMIRIKAAKQCLASAEKDYALYCRMVGIMLETTKQKGATP